MQFLKIKGLDDQLGGDADPTRLQYAAALAATKTDAQTYAGTVPTATVAKRRAVNKRARAARRINRHPR